MKVFSMSSSIASSRPSKKSFKRVLNQCAKNFFLRRSSTERKVVVATISAIAISVADVVVYRQAVQLTNRRHKSVWLFALNGLDASSDVITGKHDRKDAALFLGYMAVRSLVMGRAIDGVGGIVRSIFVK